MWYEYFLDRGLIPFPLVRYFINRLNGRTHNKLKNITDEDRRVFSELISVSNTKTSSFTTCMEFSLKEEFLNIANSE